MFPRIFPRTNYAPRNYSISYDQSFIVCCPKNEFKDPENIPVEFERVPKVDDVYRLTIASDAASQLREKHLESLQALKNADEILTAYNSYRENLGRSGPTKKI